MATETQTREHWRETQRITDAAREDHAAAEREISRNAARISALKEAQQRIKTGHAEAGPRIRTSGKALAELPAAAELENKLTEINDVIASDRGALAEVRVEAQGITRETELANRRLQAIAEERQGWNERNDSASSQIVTIGQRTEAATSERTELVNAPQKFAGQRQALIGEIDTATSGRRAAADQLAKAETDLAEADKVARAALEAVGEARAEAARSEERCEAAKRRHADIEHEIRDRLQIEPAAAAELAELKPDAELPPVSEVEARLERIQRERERLGAVNLLAEQELNEVEQQHVKLCGERDDLVEAIRRLRQGIVSLNSEARERLLSSFVIVNENFKKLFTELFGGGTAELQLDRERRPAGSRPRNHGQAAGQEAQHAVALVRRRAGPDGAGADLRGVPHQPGADLRARRGGRPARRLQCRALLRPARRDVALDRYPVPHHHAQSDHDGADEPPLRRYHGRARRVATRLGRPAGRGEAARGELRYIISLLLSPSHERAPAPLRDAPVAMHPRSLP